jgi:TonB-linked SusC/RagA family outer membrane protein
MVKNLDAYGYALAYNEYFVNSGSPAPYSPAVLDTIKNGLSPYRYANTDWVDLLTGTPSFVQNHSLGIRGGNDATKYFVFGSYTDEGGMYPTVSFKRYTVQSNLDVKLSPQFKSQINLGYRNGMQNYSGGGSPANIMNQAINTSPLVPAYLPNGSFGSAAAGGVNPLASISEQSGYQYTSTNFLTASGKLTWEPTFVKGLSAFTNATIEKTFLRGKSYAVPVPLYRVDNTSPTGYTQTAGSGKPSLTDNTSDASTYTVDMGFNYNKAIKRHTFEALALYTIAETKTNTNSDTRLNLVSPGLDILNLGSTVNETTSGSRTQAARAGYVGRIDYNFDKRLYAEASFRIDGATAFAPGHRWGFFPGASAGWILSKEKFLRSFNSIVSYLKLRASIGLTGDDNVGANTYYYTYRLANTGTSNTQGYIFGTTYSPSFFLANSTLPNVNITWAKNRQENIGLDATLWQGKLGVSFDVYRKHRYDILLSKTYNLPATFGINGPIQNYGQINDKGFEIELSHRNKVSKDLTLNLTANFTYVKTRYVENGTSALPNYQRYEGHPTNALVGYHAIGIFQTIDEIQKWRLNQDGLGNTTIKPGDIKYADLDGDGKLTAADQLWMDNYGFPPINAGFNINVVYKGLSLSALFSGAFGGYIRYAQTLTWQFTYDNAWRPGNESAKYPRLGSLSNNTKTSDATLVKDDFVRLRDVRLSYNVPERWVQSIKLKGISIYAQASNLFTWTSVIGGIDPETPNLGSGGASGGFYPNQKNIGFGLNVNF